MLNSPAAWFFRPQTLFFTAATLLVVVSDYVQVGGTALHKASNRGATAVVEKRLAKWTDPNVPDRVSSGGMGFQSFACEEETGWK